MTDVVLTLPIETGEEAQLFGTFFNRFMESRSSEAERMAESSDAPFLMLRSDPGPSGDIKVLIFQETSVAAAFSAGWAKVREIARGKF
jgi:hypothetical protein